MTKNALRWFCLILIFCFSKSQAQEVHPRIELESVTFVQMIDEIEKSYKVNFSYRSDLLKDQLFSISSSTSDLTDILDEITNIHKVEYQILNDQSILLRSKLTPVEDHSKRRITFYLQDEITGLPLLNAAIGIQNTSIGTYTDDEGVATLDIDENSNSEFEVHLLGYEAKSFSCAEKNCRVNLKPQAFQIDEIMIQDRKNLIQSNAQDQSISISSNHISTLSAGVVGKDILRQAQLLPGVSAFNDISAGLSIRGAEEQSSLIIIDDIPIYNPSHYYGMFGSINPSYTTSAQLYKNNMPIDYDGKTAGLFSAYGPQLEQGAISNGSIDINLLSVSGGLHLPIAQSGILSLAARTSYNNVTDTDLTSLFGSRNESIIQNFNESTRNQLVSSIPDFNFYDVNGRFQYGWKSGDLTLSYFRSNDDLDDTFQNSFTNQRDRIRIQNTETYSNLENWKNEGFSLKVNNKLSDQLSLSTLLYGTLYKNESGLDISLSRQLVRETRTFNYGNVRENEINDKGVRTKINWTRDNLDISAGLEFIQHNTELSVFEQNEMIQTSGSDENELSAFLSFRPKISDDLVLDFGWRTTAYKSDLFHSPRINISYRVSDEFLMKSSFGRHNQFVRKISFENLFGRNLDFWLLADHDNLKVNRSNNFMLGGTFKKGRVVVDVEGYYRQMSDLLELALVNPRLNAESVFLLSQNGGNQYRPFTGDGEVLGIDLMIGWTGKKYGSYLSYTLSESTIKYDQILRGTAFPSQDDRRHQIKFVNDYRIGDFSLGATLVYASGRPYTDLDKIAPSLRRDELRPEDRISRLPDYFRTDFGVSYALDLGDQKAEIGISAYNLLNRQNVNYIQYLFSLTNDQQNGSINTLLGTESNLLNRTINLNFSLKF